MKGSWLMQDVSVGAGGDAKKLLLERVSAEFRPGEITLLIGHNGAGKSTLLETLAGLRKLNDGSISLDGEPLWMGRKRNKLNRALLLSFGIAMQQSESQWFAPNAREELLYSLRPYKPSAEEAERRIQAALQSIGLQPDLLERDPWTLSGGQQRRLAIACLLACEPDWLLLDEPTAGLDADGTRRLCAILEAHRAAWRGAVVATHDLEALLPLADRVVVVRRGEVREAAPAEAALALAAAAPQALRAQALLRGTAALPPEAPAQRSGGAPWPTPRELAAELARERRRGGNRGGAGEPLAEAARNATAAASDTASAPAAASDTASAPADGKPETSGAARAQIERAVWLRPDYFDPRAVVLAYFLLSAFVLYLGSIKELAVGAIVVVAAAAPFSSIMRKWWKVLRGFAIVSIILLLIGGLSWSPLAFSWAKAEPAAVKLSQLMLIMVIGMPMLELMTPLRLQRAIQQTFGWMARIGIPIHSVGLLIMLIFRFIPLLGREWERFAKLAHARGKAASRLGTVPIRMLRVIFIPFVRSILRIAEEMADALEARGYGSMPAKPVYGFRVAFRRSDALMLGLAALGGFLLLIIIRLL
ncbi:ATP-binding cassette domain-containing protein [Paenibacillus soyae]|uniref:ATP-binding cassette domain-containing protein n=1 Tax=Paenibacillus soyae TaxID=2969249 RepID=A0A9X2MSK2_9BACL|nr:ATP-binding cassette domain-containing protein [Paenibacillus soyae]MCR2805098.1 ATP-binding cassette domain-containing protein [Paenibacillus soyae]